MEKVFSTTMVEVVYHIASISPFSMLLIETEVGLGPGGMHFFSISLKMNENTRLQPHLYL